AQVAVRPVRLLRTALPPPGARPGRAQPAGELPRPGGPARVEPLRPRRAPDTPTARAAAVVQPGGARDGPVPRGGRAEPPHGPRRRRRRPRAAVPEARRAAGAVGTPLRAD